MHKVPNFADIKKSTKKSLMDVPSILIWCATTFKATFG